MSEEKCGALATVRRFWPGNEPDLVCFAHALDSKMIADAMGFALALERIVRSASDASERPTCCCSKGFSQTVSC